MTTQIFTAIVYKDEAWYVAECPEVGTASQGKSVEEALMNLREATELYLEEFPIPARRQTLLTVFEAEYA